MPEYVDSQHLLEPFYKLDKKSNIYSLAISEQQFPRFNYDEFMDIDQIGDGGFSVIYKAKSKLIGEVALKKFIVNPARDKKTFKSLLQSYYNMVLQFAKNKDLCKYLKDNIGLNWTNKFYIAKEIAKGLKFLYDKDIVHQDLHSKNVLIHDKKILITDFGISKLISELSIATNSIHEIAGYIESQYKYNKKSDIYSLE
ncbi:kinase-like protein [Gigaspora margarita]|uniref:Kinase-like protein n=1 Tax=Gigaspora margarita TaxID=4874 RepID=A0A8H4AL67_GIGMA|nr:kinase-like protein [Gigaspora margarita]